MRQRPYQAPAGEAWIDRSTAARTRPQPTGTREQATTDRTHARRATTHPPTTADRHHLRAVATTATKAAKHVLHAEMNLAEAPTESHGTKSGDVAHARNELQRLRIDYSTLVGA